MITPKSTLFVLALLFASLTNGHIPDAEDGGAFSLVTDPPTEDPDDLYVELFVDDEVVVNLTVIGGPSDRYLVRSGLEFVFDAEVLNQDDAIISINESINVKITGNFLGIEPLEFVNPATEEVAGTFDIRVKRKPTIVNYLFTYVSYTWLVISYISIGALMDWPLIKQRIFPPWAVLIGMFCQFILMPVVTFLLANVLPVDNPTAVGIVLVGTCPGGWFSNILSILLDVDFILSVSMTFFSSIGGLAMMPLNIFIYATPFIQGNKNLQTPFLDLALNLIILVVAISVGMFLGYKFEKFRKFSEKVLKPIAVLLIVCGIGLAIPADFHMFYAEWPVWVAAVVTPLAGGYFGLSLARIFGMPFNSAVTIALETGVQNAFLARTIVSLYYPQPEGDLVGRVGTMTVLITLVEGVVISLTQFCIKILYGRKKTEHEENLENIEQNGNNKPTNDDLTKTEGEAGIANPALDHGSSIPETTRL